MKTEMKVPNEPFFPTDVFLISCGMGCKRITISDIAYIEAMKDNCIIHMLDGKRYTQSRPMGDIEPEFNVLHFRTLIGHPIMGKQLVLGQTSLKGDTAHLLEK